MGFLDDLKKTASDAQHAIERQVDKMQATPPGAPQPPPLDGAPPAESPEPPPIAQSLPAAPEAASSSMAQPATTDGTVPPAWQPAVVEGALVTPPVNVPSPSMPLPAGPQVRAIEESLSGSPAPGSSKPLDPLPPPAQ